VHEEISIKAPRPGRVKPGENDAGYAVPAMAARSGGSEKPECFLSVNSGYARKRGSGKSIWAGEALGRAERDRETGVAEEF
jgi:hypothetical protein